MESLYLWVAVAGYLFCGVVLAVLVADRISWLRRQSVVPFDRSNHPDRVIVFPDGHIARFRTIGPGE